jgi:DNA-binding NarL/FixJ family response regulator
MICDGLQSKEIAARLGISKKTVEAQRLQMYRKLEIHTMLELYKLIREPEFFHNAT